jgi:hypothetical protein
MYKYDALSLAKNQIWTPRQIVSVKPISIPQAVNKPSYGHLRRGVLAGDAAHVF